MERAESLEQGLDPALGALLVLVQGSETELEREWGWELGKVWIWLQGKVLGQGLAREKVVELDQASVGRLEKVLVNLI